MREREPRISLLERVLVVKAIGCSVSSSATWEITAPISYAEASFASLKGNNGV